MGGSGTVDSELVAGSQVGSFISRKWWVRKRRPRNRGERDQGERWKETLLLLRIFKYPWNVTTFRTFVFQVVTLPMFHFSFIWGSLRGFRSFQPLLEPKPTLLEGLPRGHSGKESVCQCRRHKRHGKGSDMTEWLSAHAHTHTTLLELYFHS